MKIAIVHDYLKEYGGAERVVETLLEIWPGTPVYTTVFLPEFAGPHRARVEKWNVKTSFLQHFPFKAKLISLFRFTAPIVFSMMDLTEYDVVIVSSAGTYTSPNFIKMNKKATLICYYHTPPRYLYGYPVANDWKSNIGRRMLLVLGQIPMFFLRILDKKAAQIPKYLIANSKEVAGRIKRFYGRDSTVIYPPVEIPESNLKTKASKDFYIAGGRLARAKRTDLAIMACNELKLPLKVFGRGFGGYEEYLKSIMGPTVEFLGEVTEDFKWSLYRNAKAFLYPTEMEDFGIQAVEAMAAGTPVIALAQGGPLETIVEGKTGLFFNKLTPESLADAVRKFEKMKFNTQDCITQAKKFSKERFKKEILEFVEVHKRS